MIQLISVHIPKTAGTAFRHVLLNVYGPARVLDDYPPDRIYHPGTVINPEIAVIHGHFLPSKYHNLFPKAKRIVWLRNPLFRLISEYFFAKTIKDRNNAIHAQLLDKNLSILEFAKIPQMRNFLSHHLTGMELEEFDFVGIQEFYNQDLITLKNILGWSKFYPTVKNSNRYQGYQKCLQEIMSNDNLINQLAKLNEADLQLYESALHLRAKHRQESPLIQSTLADWQRTQFLLQTTQSELKQKTQELQQANYWLSKHSFSRRTLNLTTSNTPQLTEILTGFYLDSPQFPLVINSPILSLEGWVIGKKSPATQVRIKCDGVLLSETSVNLSRPDVAKAYHLPDGENKGFKLNLNVMGIPLQTILTLEVALDDRTSVTIATLKVVP
ncbi:MAG: sulfotransferase family 2 domain-containing protein [Xenococcaceae cyanobacterium MO_167.B27]|nr:sulfotransferase family 2 domain-containing protein [Xenococcaceae cyanobacterium MO_167.B27]